MVDLVVKGGDDFYKLSKALKDAGRTQMRKELNKELRDAAKPLVGKTRQAALSQLPKRGGLAAQVAREPQRVQVRTGSQTAGVRIVVGRRRGGARGANAGIIRHPVFADARKTRKEWRWVNQRVPAGWFDKTLTDSSPEVRKALVQALESVAEKVVREVG